MSSSAILRVDSLSKSYAFGERSVQALAEVSMTLEEGEFVCLMGPSGSGKSTLLKLVAGLTQPSGGSVQLMGCELGTASERERTAIRARYVGIVFQRFNLLPSLSVRDNLRLAARLSCGDWNAARERQQTLIDRLQLGHLLDHHPPQLSGGEQQRVAVARALLHRPKLLLADEPTGSLDSKSSHRLMNLLEECHLELGVSVLLITHDPAVASRGSRQLRMEDGRLQ